MDRILLLWYLNLEVLLWIQAKKFKSFKKHRYPLPGVCTRLSLPGEMPLPAKPWYESQLASIFCPDRARQLGRSRLLPCLSWRQSWVSQKQQLSPYDQGFFEERGLVERIHDTANRRRVYIRICDSGREMMNQMKQEMLSSTLFGLRAYTPEELASMDECLCRLMELMKKFNCETDEPVKNVSVW